MTKEAAEKAAEESNAEKLKAWCPLAKMHCVVNCVCYVPASVVQRTGNEYRVTAAGCRNSMFFNECGCGGI